MNPDVGAAAANNAAWCDLIAGVHGCRTMTDGEAWSSRDRTPPLYPDAVTLRAGVDSESVLARIDASAGASVKDSFADLDLAPFGFHVLFDATWLRREPPTHASVSPPGWHRVTRPPELARWEAAWAAQSRRPRLFTDALLEEESVAVIADADVSAGAILNQAAGVVGVTNVFGPAGDHEATWTAWAAAADALFPGLPLVLYTSGADVLVAEGVGFAALGPLRVWSRD